jgi:hypothetical protein
MQSHCCTYIHSYVICVSSKVSVSSLPYFEAADGKNMCTLNFVLSMEKLLKCCWNVLMCFSQILFDPDKQGDYLARSKRFGSYWP